MTGEAAGTAAALAVKHQCRADEINIEELQKNLTAGGVIIHI